ncbi:MAG: hypothetical protein KKC01_00550 [Gammaproteobacteria bacterium]|nr:hypothetical protein [Gammaproteobacteria bacterium]
MISHQAGLRTYAGLGATMLFAAQVASAELLVSRSDGFIIAQQRTLPANTTAVFSRMTAGLSSWWDADHSFSGDAGNLRLDRDCLCEAWGDNLVRHLDVKSWLTNTCTSITTFSLSHVVCGKASLRSCSRTTASSENADHACREASPLGATDASACGVKAARRRMTMPSPLCLAGESVRSPE